MTHFLPFDLFQWPKHVPQFYQTISYSAWQCKIYIRMKFWCLQNCIDLILEHPGCPSFWPWGGRGLAFPAAFDFIFLLCLVHFQDSGIFWNNGSFSPHSARRFTYFSGRRPLHSATLASRVNSSPTPIRKILKYLYQKERKKWAHREFLSPDSSVSYPSGKGGHNGRWLAWARLRCPVFLPNAECIPGLGLWGHRSQASPGSVCPFSTFSSRFPNFLLFLRCPFPCYSPALSFHSQIKPFSLFPRKAKVTPAVAIITENNIHPCIY